MTYYTSSLQMSNHTFISFGIKGILFQSRFPQWLSGKESASTAGATEYAGSIPGLGRFPWRKAWQPTPVFLPGEFHGQRSLAGYRVSRSQIQLKQLSTHTLIPKSKYITGFPFSFLLNIFVNKSLECFGNFHA